MDDLLLEAWASGDEEAIGEVRRAVRRLAGRVLLSEPVRGILKSTVRAGLQEAEGRARHTADIADEVMHRPVRSKALLEARTLLVTGCRVIELHGDGDGDGESVDHVLPSVLVGFSLASTGLEQVVLASTSAHVHSCGHCRILVDVLRDVAASLGIRVPKLPEPPVPNPEVVVEPPDSVEPDPVEAEAIAALRVLGGGGEPPPPTRWDSVFEMLKRTETRRFGPWVVLGAVLLLITGLWLARVDPVSITRGGEIAALADRSPPQVARLSALPPEAQLALEDLARGECADAADRFGGGNRAAPAGRDGSLKILEAASWICAGDGARALEVLKAIPEESRARHRQVPWLEAQAYLLMGEANAALASLDQAIIGDVQNREQAQEQRVRLRTALGLDPNVRAGLSRN